MTYVVAVQSSIRLWSPPSLVRRRPGHAPVSAMELAQGLPEDAWRRITWREGSKAPLASRFAAIRVRPAHRDCWSSAPRAEEWFLIEWEDTELADLVD